MAVPSPSPNERVVELREEGHVNGNASVQTTTSQRVAKHLEWWKESSANEPVGELGEEDHVNHDASVQTATSQRAPKQKQKRKKYKQSGALFAKAAAEQDCDAVREKIFQSLEQTIQLARSLKFSPSVLLEAHEAFAQVLNRHQDLEKAPSSEWGGSNQEQAPYSARDGSQQVALAVAKPAEQAGAAAKQDAAGSAKASDQAASLRHGKFVTDGRVQEFVYVLDKNTDISAKSPELFDTILRHWGLARPHLLIKFQSGFAHPYHLISKKEMDKIKIIRPASEICQYFHQFENFVKNHPKTDNDDEEEDEPPPGDERSETTSRSSDADEQKRAEKIEQKALKHLNEFLYKSLSNLIDVIVRAVVRNRCWILVEGGPNGGLVLLKQAAERCREKPVILVIDSFNKKRYPYKHLKKEKLQVSLQELFFQKNGEETRQIFKAHLESLLEKWKNGERKEPQPKNITSVSAPPPEWSEEDQWEFQEMVHLSAGMTDALVRSSKPIDQPNPEPVRLGLDFWNHKRSIDMQKPEKREPDKGKPEAKDKTKKKKQQPYTAENGWPFESSKEAQSNKIRWNNWHYRGGTHYIFLDDGDSDQLVTNCLAPSGCIFLGGGGSSKKELVKMLLNGEPIVCLNNTGRLTQDFVLCHEYLCQRLFRIAAKGSDKNSGKDGAKQPPEKCLEEGKGGSMAWSPGSRTAGGTTRTIRSKATELEGIQEEQEVVNFFTARSGITSRTTMFHKSVAETSQGVHDRHQEFEGLGGALQEVNQFTRPELSELFLTYLRRGLQITKLCVVMDPLNPRECSGGRTEDKLSMCLSNFVILASNDTSDYADVEAVKAASLLKDQLKVTADAEHWSAAFATYSLLALNFLSLVVALARNSTAPWYMTWLPEEMKRWGLPTLAGLSTFLAGLMSRFRFVLRWSKARSAAAQLEAEIWKFRTRVADYIVVGAASQMSEPEDATSSSGQADALGQVVTRERKQDDTRAFFRSNVNNIFNSAMEEMGTSSIHNGGHDKLHKNSLRHACFVRVFGCFWCCRGEQQGASHRQPSLEDDKDDKVDGADLAKYGHIGIDDYYEERSMQVLDKMKHEAYILTVAQGWLEGMVVLLGTLGVLFSTFDQTELAMLCVSLGASLQAIEKFHALSNRLDAANTGERDMICAWQDWSAMEPMQRRFQTNVSRLVLTTEGVDVALISAATAGVRQTLAKKTAS